MPTAIVGSQKTAFIAIVQNYPNLSDINLPSWLNTNMVYYSDIPMALFQQQDLITWNEPYLAALLNCFVANTSDLNAAGIYVGVNSSFTNPVLLFNCNDEGGGIAITANQQGLSLLGNTIVSGSIVISANKALNYLYLGNNANVDLVDASASGSSVGSIWLRYLQSQGASLGGTVLGGLYYQVIVDEGAYYGGSISSNPDGTCANPVSDLRVLPTSSEGIPQAITHNTVPLVWTAPASAYVGTVIQYKRTSSAIWLTADATVGNYIGLTEFFFTKLDHDVFYDFQVAAICPNGAYSSFVQVLAVQTGQTLPIPKG